MGMIPRIQFPWFQENRENRLRSWSNLRQMVPLVALTKPGQSLGSSFIPIHQEHRKSDPGHVTETLLLALWSTAPAGRWFSDIACDVKNGLIGTMGTMADRSPAKNKYSWVLGSMMYLEKDVPPLLFVFLTEPRFWQEIGPPESPIKTHGSDPGDEPVWQLCRERSA